MTKHEIALKKLELSVWIITKLIRLPNRRFFGEPCNTVRTSFFCCFHTSKVCSLRIWMMPLCHPWAIPVICKLRTPLRKILLSSISQSLCMVSK